MSPSQWGPPTSDFPFRLCKTVPVHALSFFISISSSLIQALKSSSGDKVTNRKQAIAIALSEQRQARSKRKGGLMKEAMA